MRISNSNYPILKMLYNNKYDIYTPGLVNKLDRELIVETDFIKEFKRLNSIFKQNVFKPSKPFINAINDSKKKLHNLVVDCIRNGYTGIPINGTYIIFDAVYMIVVEIISPDIKKLTFYVFTNDAHPILKLTIEYNSIFENGISMICWGSSTIANNLTQNIENDKDYDKVYIDFAIDLLYMCTTIAIFKKYADVELKEVSGFSKKKYENGIHINDTNLKITYLDSKWFTTIIKSDAFKVSGHFRLQPVKVNGEWTTKLIYINDFEKLGYTAKARKLSQPTI